MKDTLAKEITEYLVEMPPDHVADLEELTDDAAELYEPAKGGGFALKASAKLAIEQTNAELQRLWAEHVRRMDEMDAKIERTDAEIARLARQAALNRAVIEAHVPLPLQPAAIALLSEALTLAVETQSEGPPLVTAETPFGRVDVSEAVAEWLGGPDGEAFAPLRQAAAGPYSAALRRMLH